MPRKMSAHNVMASIGRTLGNRESKTPAANEIRFAGDERKDKLYEPKHKQKLVRVLTVIAYVIFVSMAAILLSLYYTFVWNPKDQDQPRKKIDKPASENRCPKSPLDSLTTLSPPISNETQIERMTTKPAMIDDKQLEETNLSTTQREILTETTDIEETSVELTSVSTAQDYLNFTNTANDNDDSVT